MKKHSSPDTAGSVDRESQAQRDEVAAPDSFGGTDSGGSADRSDSNAPSLSHQTATLGLQRFSFADLQQRGVPFCRGATPALQKTPGHSRAQHKPQPRSEKYIQGCGHPSCSRTWPISGVLCSLVAAGAPDNLVAGVIGHSSTSIVQTYRRDAIRKLEAYRNEQQEKVASASASPRTSQPTESIPTI